MSFIRESNQFGSFQMFYNVYSNTPVFQYERCFSREDYILEDFVELIVHGKYKREIVLLPWSRALQAYIARNIIE